MVKIKVSDNKTTRTFYTRKDWKNGQKLYMYYHKFPKLTGDWYTDPHYGYKSFQDYYREYSEQCANGGREPDTPDEIKLKRLVAQHNDHLIDMANAGVTKVTFLESGVMVTEY